MLIGTGRMRLVLNQLPGAYFCGSVYHLRHSDGGVGGGAGHCGAERQGFSTSQRNAA